MSRIFLFTLFIIFGNISLLFSQHYLLLSKPGVNKSNTYFPNAEIGLKLKSSDTVYYGNLGILNDSIIFIGDKFIPLNQVDLLVDKNRGKVAMVIRSIVVSVGLAYLTINTVNQLAHQNKIDDAATYVFLVAVPVAYFGLKPFHIRKYKIGTKRVLRVIKFY